jgi:hypothetical protein
MKYLFLFLIPFLMILPVFAQESQQLPTDKGTLFVKISTEPVKPVIGDLTKLKIEFINPKTNDIQQHIDYRVSVTKDGAAVFGPIPLSHTSEGAVTIPVEFKENGEHKITVDVEGILFQPIPTETVTFTQMIGVVSAQGTNDQKANSKGGCLIATAAYGSELASQVQLLREVRDNIVFGTSSGTAFMSAFNQFYYSFSPTVSNWERQNPIFREVVKTSITPMLSTLSILNYVNVDSEQEMLGYGIGIILLNIGIYFVMPALVIVKLRKLRK